MFQFSRQLKIYIATRQLNSELCVSKLTLWQEILTFEWVNITINIVNRFGVSINQNNGKDV